MGFVSFLSVPVTVLTLTAVLLQLLVIYPYLSRGFPGASDGKKKSACNAGDLGSSLGWEDPLEKGMSIHSSILAWRIPWTEEPGGLQSMGSQRVRHDWMTNTHPHLIL